MSGFLELFSQYDVLGAFLVNIELTLWSALFSLILGVILVVMRISPISSLRAVAGAYVELFKNLPLTIIMVFMVLGAYAQLKLSFSDTFATNFFWLAVTGLSLYTAAFVCESLRSGINTVGSGQVEAALALGMRPLPIITAVVMPQALRAVVQPMTSLLIAVMLSTSLASQVPLPGRDLTALVSKIATDSAAGIAAFAVAAALYVATGLLIAWAGATLDKKVRILR